MPSTAASLLVFSDAFAGRKADVASSPASSKWVGKPKAPDRRLASSSLLYAEKSLLGPSIAKHAKRQALH